MNRKLDIFEDENAHSTYPEDPTLRRLFRRLGADIKNNGDSSNSLDENIMVVYKTIKEWVNNNKTRIYYENNRLDSIEHKIQILHAIEEDSTL